MNVLHSEPSIQEALFLFQTPKYILGGEYAYEWQNQLDGERKRELQSDTTFPGGDRRCVMSQSSCWLKN